MLAPQPAADVLRVEIKIKNARLYDAIAAHAIPVWGAKSNAGLAGKLARPVREFCRFHELRYEAVCSLINLRLSPYTLAMRPTELAQRLESLLEHPIAWLFPVHLYRSRVITDRIARRFVVYANETTTEHLLGKLTQRIESAARALVAEVPSPEDDTHAREFVETIDAALGKLTPRQELIIRARYGLDDGGDGATTTEVARRLNRSPARVQQIEAKALRQLRKRARSLNGLIPTLECVGGSDVDGVPIARPGGVRGDDRARDEARAPLGGGVVARDRGTLDADSVALITVDPMWPIRRAGQIWGRARVVRARFVSGGVWAIRLLPSPFAASGDRWLLNHVIDPFGVPVCHDDCRTLAELPPPVVHEEGETQCPT